MAHKALRGQILTPWALSQPFALPFGAIAVATMKTKMKRRLVGAPCAPPSPLPRGCVSAVSSAQSPFPSPFPAPAPAHQARPTAGDRSRSLGAGSGGESCGWWLGRAAVCRGVQGEECWSISKAKISESYQLRDVKRLP